MASTVVTRWQAKLVGRKALLAGARAKAAYWRTKKRHTKNGTKSYSHDGAMLADREKLVAKRKRQVAAASRVIARHSKKLGAAKGIDISNNNGTVNLAKVEGAGYDFVYCKATEGTGFHDRFFDDNVKNAKKAGLLVGAYHFLHHGNPDGQAATFSAMVKDAGCTLRPVCDVEVPGCTEADVTAFVAGVKRRLGVTPLIYTSPAFMRWTSAHGCGLWVANYGVSKPSIPAPWKSYAIWQNSSTATVPGVSGKCDVNQCPDLSIIVT